jgi:hypothetical protein
MKVWIEAAFCTTGLIARATLPRAREALTGRKSLHNVDTPNTVAATTACKLLTPK